MPRITINGVSPNMSILVSGTKRKPGYRVRAFSVEELHAAIDHQYSTENGPESEQHKRVAHRCPFCRKDRKDREKK
jgi:hypothetical protein